jgi:predicted nucleic acid-binding protein
MNYWFDTNLLLLKLRQHPYWQQIHNTYQLNTANNLISVVSSAELYSLALRNNWGPARIAQMDALRKEFVEMDLYYEEVIQTYAQIDAFSQGKLAGKPLLESSRNMGKNDLWIAATASAFDLTLLTTDADFNHLNKHFLNVNLIRVS